MTYQVLIKDTRGLGSTFYICILIALSAVKKASLAESLIRSHGRLGLKCHSGFIVSPLITHRPLHGFGINQLIPISFSSNLNSGSPVTTAALFPFASAAAKASA